MVVEPLKRLDRVTTGLLGPAWWMLSEPIKKLFKLMGETTVHGLVQVIVGLCFHRAEQQNLLRDKKFSSGRCDREL